MLPVAYKDIFDVMSEGGNKSTYIILGTDSDVLFLMDTNGKETEIGSEIIEEAINYKSNRYSSDWNESFEQFKSDLEASFIRLKEAKDILNCM